MKQRVAVLSLALLISACSLLEEDDGEPTNPDSNNPPTVELVASPTSGPAPLNVILTATASDPEGDKLRYSWSLAGLPDTSTVTTELTEVGEYPVSVVVSDGENEVSASTTVTVTAEGTDPTDPEPPVDEPQITVKASPGGPVPWMVRYDYSATIIPEGGSVKLTCANDIGTDYIVKGGLGPNSIACLHIADTDTVQVQVLAGEDEDFEVLASEMFKADVEPVDDVPFAGTWRFTIGDEPPVTFVITQPLESGAIGGRDETDTYSIYYVVEDAVGNIYLNIGRRFLSALGGDFSIQPLEDGTQRFVSTESWADNPFVLEKID